MNKSSTFLRGISSTSNWCWIFPGHAPHSGAGWKVLDKFYQARLEAGLILSSTASATLGVRDLFNYC